MIYPLNTELYITFIFIFTLFLLLFLPLRSNFRVIFLRKKMNKCKYIKQKINGPVWCTKENKKCTNCDKKEYTTTCHSKSKFRQKSKKLTKLERERFSLFSNNKDKCYLCPATTNLTWHEIYRGKNRANSMKYGLCLRICLNCHEKYQEDKEFNDYWHKQAQITFNKYYPNLNFLEIFKRNYL